MTMKMLSFVGVMTDSAEIASLSRVINAREEASAMSLILFNLIERFICFIRGSIRVA